MGGGPEEAGLHPESRRGSHGPQQSRRDPWKHKQQVPHKLRFPRSSPVCSLVKSNFLLPAPLAKILQEDTTPLSTLRI